MKSSFKKCGAAVSMALLAGLVYALLTYSPTYLRSSGPAWQMCRGDTCIHLTGTNFYIRDEWRFPLFAVQGLNYPEGTNIIYTDSLPLLALPAKGLYQAAGVAWNYFGPWVLLTSLLTGLSTLVFLRSLNLRSLPVLAVSLLFVFCSFPHVRRIGHIALNSHFLIVLALSLYFLLQRPAASAKWLWAFTVLAAVSLWIHVYLFAMVFLLLVTTAVSLWSKRNAGERKELLRWFVATSIGLGVLMVVSGHISLDPSGGFQMTTSSGHRSSMNIISLICPPPSSPLHAPFFKDPTGKQFSEGLNYLGMGAILLWGCLLVRFPARIREGLQRHRFLVLLCLGLFLFSLSYRIYFAGVQLVDLSCIPGIRIPYLVFRATGRFFWPVFYLLLLLPVPLLWQWTRNRKRTLLLLILLALIQNLEILPLRSFVRDRTRPAAVPAKADFFASLVKQHDLILIDENDNVYSTMDPQDLFCLLFLSGRYQTPINFSPAARQAKENTPFLTLAGEAIRNNRPTLFVVPPATLDQLPLDRDHILFQTDDMVILSTGRPDLSAER